MKKKKAPSPDQTPTQYSKGFYEWPDSWMGFDEDLVTGKKMLAGFIPFIKELAENALSRRTITTHMENLWVLGSEIISGVHYNEGQRKLSGKALLLEYIEEEGGPLVHQWDPDDKTEEALIKSYEATCRKLYKFLKGPK